MIDVVSGNPFKWHIISMQHKADLDPLNLDGAYAEMDLGGTYGHPNASMQKLIDYTYYGFTEADLDR